MHWLELQIHASTSVRHSTADLTVPLVIHEPFDTDGLRSPHSGSIFPGLRAPQLTHPAGKSKTRAKPNRMEWIPSRNLRCKQSMRLTSYFVMQFVHCIVIYLISGMLASIPTDALKWWCWLNTRLDLLLVRGSVVDDYPVISGWAFGSSRAEP